MKKVLLVTSSACMILRFNLENIRLLQSLDCQVDIACNFVHGNTCDDQGVQELKRWCAEHRVGCHQVDFDRNVYHFRQNIRAYTQLLALLRANSYAFIHCHTPIGGVIARLAGHAASVPVIYTAHGFHFFSGAPLKNWLLYYPVERLLAHRTDTLITINHEDYARARKFAAKHVAYIPGVGIDTVKFQPMPELRASKRAALGLKMNDIVLLTIGELIPRKNHAAVLRALAMLKGLPNFPRMQLLICGRGEMDTPLRDLALAEGISDHVRFLHYRQDIAEICNASDLFIFASHQEGLSVALMEAMACGMPVIASRIRGNTDLIEDGVSGLLISGDAKLAPAIESLAGAPDVCAALGAAARERTREFATERVQALMRDIYASMLEKIPENETKGAAGA